jgi:hypothetical protein
VTKSFASANTALDLVALAKFMDKLLQKIADVLITHGNLGQCDTNNK